MKFNIELIMESDKAFVTVMLFIYFQKKSAEAMRIILIVSLLFLKICIISFNDSITCSDVLI